MTRDMNDREFRAALKKHGMVPVGFLGYVEIPVPTTIRPGHTVSVSMLNAGTTRLRDILAFLLREKDRLDREATS